MTVALVATTYPRMARKAVELLGGMDKFIKEGEKVIVKPNICVGKTSETGAVTDPEIVAEICQMVVECGAEPTVADSPIYPFNGDRVLQKSGYREFEKKYKFPVLNLDAQHQVDIVIPQGKAIQHSVIARPILECDKIINVPVLKTHIQPIVTLGLKNIKGVVSGKHKHIIHIAGLSQGIVDLNTVIKPVLTIADGIIGMEGALAPTNGTPIEVGVIVAGNNVVEVDSVCCQIMGIEPKKIEHIRLAFEQGLGSIEGFEILGDDIDKVKKNFIAPGTPGLYHFINFIKDITALRFYYFVRNPLARIFGGEPVEKKAKIPQVIIDKDKCNRCLVCLKACPEEALSFEKGKNRIPDLDKDKCIYCFCCAEACSEGAISKRV